MFFQNLQMIYYNVFMTSQIAGLFDHKYLWKDNQRLRFFAKRYLPKKVASTSINIGNQAILKKKC